MKFSIITPSLGRESLKRCVESIDSQSYDNWQHLIGFDGMSSPVPDFLYPIMLDKKEQRRRWFLFKKTHQWGNHQRHSAWKYATGDFILWLDDDNRMCHPDSLKDIADRIESNPGFNWYLFPINRHGSIFLMEPPGMCMTDSANMVIRREYAQWPDTEAREADGMLAEQLKAEHPYMAFPDCPPIITMEHSSNGQ